MKNAALVVALLALQLNATAEESDDANAAEDVRQYTVEMIVFRYAQTVSAGTEVFPADVPVSLDEYSPDDAALQETKTEQRPTEPTAVVLRKVEIARLNPADFTLGDSMQHLKRLDAYQPMMHFGWTQTMHAGSEVSPRPLSSFATPPRGLQGEIALYLGRYLHLDVSLQLDATNSIDPVRYRIDEDRIFRNGELRYFDHPRFGALARITRVEQEAE